MPEQEAFLTRRFQDAVKNQPELMQLSKLLLRHGGDLLVAPPKADPDIQELLESGILTGAQ
jgi:hypothetical protein